MLEREGDVGIVSGKDMKSSLNWADKAEIMKSDSEI